MLKKIFLPVFFCLSGGIALAQQKKIQFTVGPEVLKSFNHSESFWGAGGSVQAEAWVAPALGLGVNTGYYRHVGTGTAAGRSYGAIPVLAVIRYTLPITPGLYGQDVLGYTLVQDVASETNGRKVSGGFTYYFAIGYVIRNHFDISLKVGRSRLDKKDHPANVNEHNLGLKIAYRF